MNVDDPKLTAYALGELDESIDLDGATAKVVEETALIASVLRAHYNRPRRRHHPIRYAMAASVLIVGLLVLIFSHRPSAPQNVAVVPVQQPAVRAQPTTPRILRLTPALAEISQASSLTTADYRGIPALDVEQLLAAVIQDASRVGSFTSLRLSPESTVVFQ